MLRSVDSNDRYGKFANSSIPETAVQDDGHPTDVNRTDISNLIAEAQRCIIKDNLGSLKNLGIEAIQKWYQEIADEIYLMQTDNNSN